MTGRMGGMGRLGWGKSGILHNIGGVWDIGNIRVPGEIVAMAGMCQCSCWVVTLLLIVVVVVSTEQSCRTQALTFLCSLLGGPGPALELPPCTPSGILEPVVDLLMTRHVSRVRPGEQGPTFIPP